MAEKLGFPNASSIVAGSSPRSTASPAAIHRQNPSQVLIAKHLKRFERYEDSMFTFLTSDGIPWNNNAAERALRHLAVQRKISGAFTRKGATEYLRLLGIMQTCRFQGQSFLGFLLSECLDVDRYAKQGRSRVPKPVDNSVGEDF